jgi:hypothetical protein
MRSRRNIQLSGLYLSQRHPGKELLLNGHIPEEWHGQNELT